VTLIKLSAASDTAIVRNNIFWCRSPLGNIQLMSSLGSAYLGTNWFPREFASMLRFVGGEEGVHLEKEQVLGADPGFRDADKGDFTMVPGSACIGRADPLPAAMLPQHACTAEYVPHGGHRSRNSGPAGDLGAFGSAPEKAQ
jgi:hypothetical protein